MSSRMRLSKDDVKVIFDCVSNNVLPPSNLSFSVLIVPSSNAKVSPPPFEYKGGIYVMIAASSNGIRAAVPSALADFVATDQELASRKACNWRSSGLKSHRSNLPDAKFLIRYCYPVGDNAYSESNGATVWTMRDEHGKEDLACRILHVYPTQKRASPTQSDHPKRQKLTNLAERGATGAADIEDLMTGELVSTPVGISFTYSSSDSDLSNPEGIFDLSGSDPYSLLHCNSSFDEIPVATASISRSSPDKRYASFALSPRLGSMMAPDHESMVDKNASFSMKLASLTCDILSSDLPVQTQMIQMLQDTVKKLKTESTGIKAEFLVTENYTITP